MGTLGCPYRNSNHDNFLRDFIGFRPYLGYISQVIKGLAATGLPLPPLAWALALGTDVGCNGTPIGASANVVGIAIAEKEGSPISCGRFCKYTLSAMILVVGVCWVFLIVRYAS